MSPRCCQIVVCCALFLLFRAPLILAALVYSNDFNQVEGTSYVEWTSSAITFTNRVNPPGSGILPAPRLKNITSPNGARRFLGLLGGPAIGTPRDPGWNRTRVDQTVSLSISNLPAHCELKVVFDLLVIRSWDGNSPTYGPDRFSLSWVGGQTLLDTSFSNNPKTNTEGSYQDYPRSNSSPWSGVSEIGTLGYDRYFKESVYRFQFQFGHTNQSVDLQFQSSLNEGKGTDDEAWGLDNVVVLTDGT